VTIARPLVRSAKNQYGNDPRYRSIYFNDANRSNTQLYSRPRNVSSFSSRGNGYGFLEDSGVMKMDGRRLTQHFVSAGVTNVARVAVDITTEICSSRRTHGHNSYGITMAAKK